MNIKGKYFQNLTNQDHLLALRRHKFTNINEITIDNLNFRKIIALFWTYTYNTAKGVAKYLKPL